MSTVVVAGSLWSVPPASQATALVTAAARGLRHVHWDTTDGRFAPPGGFSPETARALTQHASAVHEAHVMALDPVEAVDAWTETCSRVVVHLENEDWSRAVDRIVRRGAQPAIALSPGTPSSAAPVDLPVLCMSVTPGHAGSTFDRRALDKVADLAERNADRTIGLDGGVTRDVAEQAVAAGASWLVVGTDLFGAGGLERWADLLGGREEPPPVSATGSPEAGGAGAVVQPGDVGIE